MRALLAAVLYLLVGALAVGVADAVSRSKKPTMKATKKPTARFTKAPTKPPTYPLRASYIKVECVACRAASRINTDRRSSISDCRPIATTNPAEVCT